MKQKNFEEALSSLASLCAESEKCKADVIQKAVKWGLTREEGEQIAEKLEQNNFINEFRYASFFVRDKYRLSKWGKDKILYALRGKRIPEEYIDVAMQQILNDDYTEILLGLLRAKVKTVKYDSLQSLRAKLYNFSKLRGYETENINKAIKKIFRELKKEESDED